jgi:hypothetical protein
MRAGTIEEGEVAPVWLVKVGLTLLIGVVTLITLEVLLPAALAGTSILTRLSVLAVAAVAATSYWQDGRSRKAGEQPLTRANTVSDRWYGRLSTLNRPLVGPAPPRRADVPAFHTHRAARPHRPLGD